MLIQLDFTVAFELAVRALLSASKLYVHLLSLPPAKCWSLGETLIAHRSTEDQYQTGISYLMFVIAAGSLGEALRRTENRHTQ